MNLSLTYIYEHGGFHIRAHPSKRNPTKLDFKILIFADYGNIS